MKRTKRALALLCLALALTLLMGTAYAASPLLRRGSRGADVKQLQGNLIYLGYLNDVADGIFGAKTEAAVRRYQSRNGLGWHRRRPNAGETHKGSAAAQSNSGYGKVVFGACLPIGRNLSANGV